MYFSQTKFGHYYFKSLQVISEPFVRLNHYTRAVQENPEAYYSQKEVKKISAFLEKCDKIKAEDKSAQKFANKAAQYYLTCKNEELQEQLKVIISRLRRQPTEEEKAKLENLMGQLQNLLSSNAGVLNAGI